MKVPFANIPPHADDIHSIEVKKHGHYALRPKNPAPGLPVLLGFHGYAESAHTHLELLEAIELPQSWLRCSVESLNLFYTKSQKIVGNWMTSLDRDNAIADNISYVDAVIEQLRQNWQASSDLVYLGFSQGGPMTYRSALLGKHRAKGLIVLAGDLPPELADEDLSSLPPILLCRGEQDSIMPDEQIERDKAIFDKKGVACEVFRFTGGHGWNEAFCEKAAEFISSL